jgi:multiple sugar transport system substrate-binding protein
MRGVKRTIAAAVLLAAFAVFAEVAGRRGSAAPVTIRFWNGWTGPDGELLKTLVDYYNGHNKDKVTVKMDILSFSALQGKLAAALASGTAPELYLSTGLGELPVQGQLVAIDDVFERTRLRRSDFVEGILEQMTYKGKLYGLPFQVSSHYLFWNKELFRKAGLDPEKPPATWEELMRISKRITDPRKNLLGGGFVYNQPRVFPCLLLSYGGGIVGGTGVGDFKSLLADPAYRPRNLAALGFLKEMVSSGSMPAYTSSQYETMFLAGRCGMVTGGAWIGAGCRAAKIDFGVSLLPSGPVRRAQVATPIALVVLKGTEGARLDAAYSFMEYWNDNLANQIRDPSPAYEWSTSLGYQPYLKSVASDPRLARDPVFKVTNSYAEYACEYYPASFYKFLSLTNEILVPLSENVAFARMAPEAALAEADKSLKALIASFGED